MESQGVLTLFTQALHTNQHADLCCMVANICGKQLVEVVPDADQKKELQSKGVTSLPAL